MKEQRLHANNTWCIAYKYYCRVIYSNYKLGNILENWITLTLQFCSSFDRIEHGIFFAYSSSKKQGEARISHFSVRLIEQL